MNPLLDFSGLPRFAEIKTEHIAPAVDELLARNRALTAKLAGRRRAADVGQFRATVRGRERAPCARLGTGRPSQHGDELGRNCARCTTPICPRSPSTTPNCRRTLRCSANTRPSTTAQAYAALNAEQKKVIENELRDFRLGGAELPEDKKARFMAIQEELSALTSKFSDNLLDATNAFTCVVENEDDISGIPADERQVAAEAAKEAGKTGWLFTLKAPSYGPVMQYADNRSLRERMYRAYTTRASEQSTDDKKAEHDNTPLMSQILKLRAEEAHMLGFANFAELSLASKMADTPQQVAEFLRELAQRAKPFAEKDLQELRAFAAAELGLQDLQAWDVGYASEKLRQQRYAFSEQEVKQYFPEDAVRVRTVRSGGDAVRPQDRAFHCAGVARHACASSTSATTRGKLIGQFYLDLYARASKRGGAWMDDAITRRRTAKGIQTPVAYLNCNFASPLGGKPALFTHDEVNTLFHEFGHGLHHLLTQVEELGVSGISGVEWDAVELPSQFMENFCWEWDVLQGMTRHSETGEKLPRALFDKMIAAKNFQSGLQMLRQIEFSLFDLRLHSEYDCGRNANSAAIAGRSTQRSRGPDPALVQPLPEQLLAHFCGRLCGGLLQLQMGGSAVGGCLQPVRRKRRAGRGHRQPFPGTDPGRGRQSRCDGIIQGVPWARTQDRCAVAA